MNRPTIYPKDWLHLHPYKAQQPSDAYFVALANQLHTVCHLPQLSAAGSKRLCLYLAAYLEDQISDLGLWQAFTAEHTRLYGATLPFYTPSADYVAEEVNLEDICFLIWNTWQKEPADHPYVHPMDDGILPQAQRFYEILSAAYEEAPENSALTNYFGSCHSAHEADVKLTWLFGHTYLTEPSMLPYIDHVAPTDRFIIPVGPLALFLHEWITLLGGDTTWKQVPGLYVEEPTLPAEMIQKNIHTYELFTAATGGQNIVFLNGYDALRHFLTEALQWPDDANHTLPQLKESRNFILMVNREKGILLAKDICEYLAAPQNPLYQPEEASHHAFRLLTHETLCPPDLLVRSVHENWLPDLQFPDTEKDKELAVRNADFIARHSLLYYYRGD